MKLTVDHSMKPWRIRWVVAGIIVILLLAWAWERGWLSGEPSYQGRTVTEWLDKLALYHYRNVPGSVEIVQRAPEEITRDPAFAALMKIGSKGVPIFIQTLRDRAEPAVTPSKRWKLWLKWKWRRMLGGRGVEPDLRSWSEFQKARKTTAAFALVIIGTNAGGGFSTFMETYASAPKHESIYGTKVSGAPVGLVSSMIAQNVVTVAPGRREEVVGEIMAGLQHTNAWCRIVALEWARRFPEELLRRRKDQLMKLTRDPDAVVQEVALGTMMLFVQQDALASLMPPAEVAQVARTALEDPATSQRVRELAEVVLNLATNR